MKITSQTSTSDVRYNPVNGSFEALITLDDAVSYDCIVKAPMSMTPEMAARALYNVALRQHAASNGLRSSRQPMPRMHAALRPATWFERLGFARAA